MDKETKEQVVVLLRKLASEIENRDKNLSLFNYELSRDHETAYCVASDSFVNKPSEEYNITLSLDFKPKGA